MKKSKGFLFLLIVSIFFTILNYFKNGLFWEIGLFFSLLFLMGWFLSDKEGVGEDTGGLGG